MDGTGCGCGEEAGCGERMGMGGVVRGTGGVALTVDEEAVGGKAETEAEAEVAPGEIVRCGVSCLFGLGVCEPWRASGGGGGGGGGFIGDELFDGAGAGAGV